MSNRSMRSSIQMSTSPFPYVSRIIALDFVMDIDFQCGHVHYSTKYYFQTSIRNISYFMMSDASLGMSSLTLHFLVWQYKKGIGMTRLRDLFSPLQHTSTSFPFHTYHLIPPSILHFPSHPAIYMFDHGQTCHNLFFHTEKM